MSSANCMLGGSGIGANCRYTCGTCGWNPEIAKARSAEIKANGLTLCPDGLHRFIIRKGVETDVNP